MACSKKFSKCITQARCGCITQTFTRNLSLKAKKLTFPVNGSTLNMNSLNSNHWKLLNQLKDYLTKTSSSQSAGLKTDKNVTTFELTKEWINFLQKYSPTSILGIHIQNMSSNKEIKSIEQEKPKETLKLNNRPKIPQTPNIINKDRCEIAHSWQTSDVDKRKVISDCCSILSSIATADSIPSKLKRIEELIYYINRYPAARILSVKEGAVNILLRTRETYKDYALQQVIREALAILGYTDPLPCKGIRILSIDGGGIRGIAVIELLRKLEQVSGKRIYEMFDYICGVSTGSILLSIVGVPSGRSLDEALQLYMSLSSDLFTQNKIKGLSKLLYSYSFYDSHKFELLLREFIGETPMIETNRKPNCPKISVVSTIVNRDRALPYIFRNYCIPYHRQSTYSGSHRHSMWQAARASSAAPLYFEEYHLDGFVHQDGGITVNNPAAVALHEALLLWPKMPIQCVVSCGTGRNIPKIEREQSESHDTDSLPPKETTASSLVEKFLKVLDSATDTEGVHTVLSDLLPPGKYFRFNPYLTDMISLDETKPEKLAQLRLDTDIYIRKNEKKFHNAVKTLLEEKSTVDKIKDYVKSKTYLMSSHL